MRKKQKFVKLLIVVLTVFFAFSCRKIMQEENKIIQTDSQIAQKFFLTSGIDPALELFSKEIKRQDDQEHFLKFFAEKNGFPLWSKSIVRTKPEGTIAIIPLALNNNSETNGFIIAKMSPQNSFSFSIYRKDLFDDYGYGKKSIGLSAPEVQTIINNFDRTVFNKKSFKLSDSRLLPLQIQKEYPNKLHKNFLMGKFRPKQQDQLQTNSMSCVTIHEDTDWWWDPDGEDDPCHCSGNEYYAYTTTQTAIVCFNTADEGGGGGGSGGGSWWSPGSGGGGSDNYITDVVYLTAAINIDPVQASWLNSNPVIAEQIKIYVSESTLPGGETKQKALDHIKRLISDGAYLSFVNGQITSGSPGEIWWEDEAWLSNPNNFNLDITRASPTQLDELTPEEKILIAVYPIQAFIIRKNVNTAFMATDYKMGITGAPHEGWNDKKDAFRHAFFQAINVRDVHPSLVPPATSSMIVRAFGIAHESQVPSQLSLERTMDLYNNEVGISYCWNCLPGISTDKNIASALKNKLDNGELRYLMPLNHSDPFWGTGNTDTNGITSSTQLTPTNQ